MVTENIPIDSIKIVDNIRKEYNDLENLAASIKDNGLLSPITVSLNGNNKYNLIIGHRRFLACKSLGHESIPAIVKEFDDVKIIQLAENIQRSNLNREESSKVVYDLLIKTELSIHNLSKLLHKSDTWTSDRKDYYLLNEHCKTHESTCSKVSTSYVREIVKNPKDTWNLLVEKFSNAKYYNRGTARKDIINILSPGKHKTKTGHFDKVKLDKSKFYLIHKKFPITEPSPLMISITFTSDRHKYEVLSILKEMGGVII